MPAANTYTQIASTTLGSATATVTFSSIPSTYTDLVLVMQPVTTAAGNTMYIQFNSIAGTSYSGTALLGNGTSASSNRRTNSGYGTISENVTSSATAGNTTCIINIFNYANTTTFKTYLARGNNGNNGVVEAQVGLCSNTAAISSLTFLVGGTTYAAGSTFNLYGITAA